MKWLLITLVLVFVGLQYRLWVGEGSLAHVARLQRQMAEQEQENQRLRLNNERLSAEVEALRNGYDAIEAKAREELGMVKEGETFFLFLEPDSSTQESQ